jgi:hypothetical protein
MAVAHPSLREGVLAGRLAIRYTLLDESHGFRVLTSVKWKETGCSKA